MNAHHYTPILAVCFLFLVTITNAQEPEIIKITGEAKVEFSDNKSLMEVKKEAEDAAIVNALEKAFGVAVIHGNASYDKEISIGNTYELSTVFYSIGNQWVNGELVELLTSEYEESIDTIILNKNEIRQYKQMKCTVSILAREIIDNMADFEAYALNCLNIHCKTTTFKSDKDDFYLYFKCPASGYLSIFLDDGNQAQRLFPYRNMGEKFERGVPVEANKEYFLFSNEEPYRSFETKADEYQLYVEAPMEQNRLYIIFSYSPIVQPYIDNAFTGAQLTEAEKNAGWKLPVSLSSEEFLKWMNKNRSVNRNIKIKLEDIIIKK